jgi:hypothetical protein
LLEQLSVDRALGLNLAGLGVDKHPALLDPAIGRRQLLMAITLRERGHGLQVGLSQGGLGFTQGRWDTGDPLHLSPGELLEIVCAVEGTISHQASHAIGRLQLANVLADDLSKVLCVATIATEGFH